MTTMSEDDNDDVRGCQGWYQWMLMMMMSEKDAADVRRRTVIPEKGATDDVRGC
jgi:hypothetical protein